LSPDSPLEQIRGKCREASEHDPDLRNDFLLRVSGSLPRARPDVNGLNDSNSIHRHADHRIHFDRWWI
jgi:hypothetical protein